MMKRGSVMACSVIALLGLGACSDQRYAVDNPLDQSPYLWPATAPAVVAKGAHPATATTVFTVRTSEWLNTPEQATALIAQQCGPLFKTARVFRHEVAGSPLHPVELVVYCGDLKQRAAVYPEPGAEPVSENLTELTYPLTGAERGELITLR